MLFEPDKYMPLSTTEKLDKQQSVLASHRTETFCSETLQD